jgi:hypothetical protein
VVQGLEEHTTPRRYVTRRPQPNPNSSVYSIGGGTIFTNSTESFETIVNVSDISLTTQVAASEHPQSTESEIDLQVELPTTDGLPTSSSSAPLANPQPELRYRNPNFSTPSIGSSLIFIPNGSLESLANVCDTFSSSASPPNQMIPSYLPGRIKSRRASFRFGSGKYLETGSRNATMIPKAGGLVSHN